MERCQTDKESLGRTPEQQQYQPKHQQQTIAEEQRCPFFLPTTPVWGDRNVSEQSVEETNNNFGYSFAHLNPSTSDAETPTSKHKKSPSTSSSSSILSLNESTMNNQPSSDVTQLPRKCILCPYVAKQRTEYIEHVITHCVYMKSSYIENDVLNGYIEDEDTDDSTIEFPSKGKKKYTGARPKPCTVCNFTAKTRLSLWMHLRQHFVRNECPGFVCTSCPFATMLKHHMTFHWFSAHDDFRGFNCRECSYTCVSKSMLTSHMKTHSNVYQYNCASCPYKTKFCNAMKKHLKDSMHIPRTVLNPDGSPNPFITIDVYGNKRGPRQRPFVEGKKNLTEIIEDKPSTSGASPSVASIPISSTPRSPRLSRASISSTVTSGSPDSNVSLPTPSSSVRISPAQTPHQSPYSNPLVTATLAMFNSMNSENGVNPNISGQFTNTDAFSVLCQLLFKDIAARQNVDDKEQGQVFRLLENAQKFLLSASEHVEHTASTTDTDGDLSNNEKNIDKLSTPTTPPSVSEPQPAARKDDILEEPLDLSMSTMSRSENQPQFQQSVASSSSRRNKRKRKAMKLEYPTDENTNDDETLTWNTNQIYTEPSLPALLTASRSDYQAKNKTPNVTHNANINDTKFVCYHCHIIFGNEIMYAVHMSFHNAKNPLMCAVCDQKSANIIAFFLHLIRTKH